MATDARISVGLPGHPKTKKLMRRLGAAGPLGCVYLFIWAAANRSDGDLSGMSDEDIELAVDWSGEEGAFVAAMVEVGFLDGDETARTIHNWAEHNPWAAGSSDRAESSKWAALCKRYGRDGAAERMPEYATRMRGASESHAGRTKPQCGPDAPSPYPIPSPSPSPIPNPKDKAQAPLPDWLPMESWNGYAEMRKRIRKPMTARAQQLVLKSLEDMRAKGLSVAQALDNSTRNSWIDVYEPKEKVEESLKLGSEGYFAAHRTAAWWREAGFDSVYEAHNARCWHHNADQFRDGKRQEVAA